MLQAKLFYAQHMIENCKQILINVWSLAGRCFEMSIQEDRVGGAPFLGPNIQARHFLDLFLKLL